MKKPVKVTTAALCAIMLASPLSAVAGARETDPYAYSGEPLNTVEMRESTQNAVLKGMYDLTRNSLYYEFQNCIVSAGAKTGTAEIGGGDLNGVFIAFAPYDDPQIAVAVAIEKAEAGTDLAPIAVDILNAYFSRDEIGTVIVGENALIQ